jgi:hypothetical protein
MGVRKSEKTLLLKRSSGLAVTPPVEPILDKLADELPVGAYLYEMGRLPGDRIPRQGRRVSHG